MLFLILITVIIALIAYLLSADDRPKGFPPGPKWYPFIGNTSLIRNLAMQHNGQHIAFEKLSEQYKSPVIGLKLGGQLVVVALTYPIVKEVHNKEEFDGRPDNFFLRLRTMGTRLGITCTDGPLWSEHRNFAVRHLRNAGYGKQAMEIQIQNELNELLDLLKNLNGKPVWPGEILPPSVINVLWTFTTGQRVPRTDDRLQKLLKLLGLRSKAFDMSGGILNQMPWLRFIAPEKTGYNLIKRFNEELNQFFKVSVDQHHRDYDKSKASDDLIYAYIKEMKKRENDPNSTFTDIQLTMTILDIFIAGSQTTSITLDLALMMMAVCPDIQKKIQEEIDENLDQQILPKACDHTKVPYTDAFLLEVQRFFHIVPISGPRRALKETTLGEYRIPKDTTILIGLKTVHKDKEHWGDPKKFRPERFLDKNNSIHNTEHLIPFGLARRRCLGEILAKACLFTFFVGIMQKFHLSCKGEKPSIDLLPGITLSPKPYKMIFTPRL